MTRDATTFKYLMVKLPPELHRRLKIEAARHHTDMSKVTREALVAHLERLEEERRAVEVHGEALVQRMRGRATAGLSTDEIMALTRGE